MRVVRHLKALICLAICLCFYNIKAQNLKQTAIISKNATQKTNFLDKTIRNARKQNLPYFIEKEEIKAISVPSLVLENSKTRELTSDELKEIEAFKSYITESFQIEELPGTSAKKNYIYAKIVPIRLNQNSGKYEYLESYTAKWNYTNSKKTSGLISTHKTTAANSSVLASGKWYKIGLSKEGVYKLDKSFLASLGLDLTAVDPRNIRIYGNGGKLMPEHNSVFRYDDLQENAISVVGESDGVFDDNDYVVFYGQSTDTWKKESNPSMPYNHYIHYFSDTSYYFITADLGLGKRVITQSSSINPPNKTTSTQDYFGFHEQNITNVVKSGRNFFGEKFDFNTSYSFSFNIPDAVIGDSVYLSAGALSRSDVTSNYNVSFSGASFTFSCQSTVTSNYLSPVGFPGYASKGAILNSNFLNVVVTKLTSAATGWLDNVEFSCRRNLIYNQTQFNFRDRRVIGGSGTFANYSITNNSSSNPLVWDVTNPLNPVHQSYNQTGNILDFTTNSDSLKEFVVFSENQCYIPVKYGSIPNQNLHATQQADYVIVTHPLFINEAQRLANLHSTYDTLTYVIATTDQIYNEFSSGTPDIGGIRDFVKMLYKRPADPAKATKYLLLLGDGSYKNKDITVKGNSALIPTHQTEDSWTYTTSFVSDDYFAMMDDTEGDLNPLTNDIVDIGVGRFPVRTQAEANAVTTKVENYYKLNNGFNPFVTESSCSAAGSEYPQGDWRNWVCFLADDEDGALHMVDANKLANKVYNNHKDYNVDKIFIDAYTQESTPGGDRYPGAVEDINHRFEKGCLIFNYTGHGGELGLTAERIVEVSQILNWKNMYNLPLMVTATCEFSRFDDPDRTSAGEYCLLNDKGGAVALMTTVRLAFSSLNYSLNDVFYNHALYPMANGKMPHVGDLYQLTKSDFTFNEQYTNFVILGDPALKLAYPQQKVYTSTINSHSVTPLSMDTLSALSKITITGYVGDSNGNKLTNFNGVVFPSVFDKPTTINNLNNDGTTPIMSFILQKNLIYRGKSQVINGDFSFTFLVPKDIAYNFGVGKISYYAHNGVNDANGNSERIMIGGSNPNAIVDNDGPTIKLYMNDNKFAQGGTTNENPKIYALVADSSGINTIGTGIGHDVLAILDENSSKPYILNDYYTADLNTYQSGKILYPFSELSEGSHRLSLKVWDVQNNSSTAYTDFIVAKEAELALSHILNYPNPFTTKTKFFIEHNQCCTSLRVLIQIYTISGKMVKSITQTINNEGFRYDGIEWDGKDDFGDKLARGVYIYKVSVTDNSKKKAEKIEKLVILN